MQNSLSSIFRWKYQVPDSALITALSSLGSAYTFRVGHPTWSWCKESSSQTGGSIWRRSRISRKCVPLDGQLENQVAAADGAAWQSLPPYFTIATTTARDKSVGLPSPIHTSIVAGAVHVHYRSQVVPRERYYPLVVWSGLKPAWDLGAVMSVWHPWRYNAHSQGRPCLFTGNSGQVCQAALSKPQADEHGLVTLRDTVYVVGPMIANESATLFISNLGPCI